MDFGIASFGLGEAATDLSFRIPANRKRRYGTQHVLAGYGGILTTLHFHAWAVEQPHFPFPEQVIDRFAVSRATANRWLNVLAEFYGIERPRRNAQGEVIS